MIVKTKYLCKAGSQQGSGIGRMYGNPNHPLVHAINSNPTPTTWIDRFVEGKWYEAEYETWDWEDGYRINGGWRRYWVVNESGKKEEMPRSHMNVLFHHDTIGIRNSKIDEILNISNSPDQ